MTCSATILDPASYLAGISGLDPKRVATCLALVAAQDEIIAAAARRFMLADGDAIDFKGYLEACAR